ncbi:hypothetical protein AAF712_009509, partial [Marasmius tenuissimus]
MSDESNNLGHISLPSSGSGSSTSGAGTYCYSALNRARAAKFKFTKAVSLASGPANWHACAQ